MFDPDPRISGGAQYSRPNPLGGTVRFTVPKSPLRLDDARADGRNREASPASDRRNSAPGNFLSRLNLYQPPPAFRMRGPGQQSGASKAVGPEAEPDEGESDPAEENEIREPGAETDPNGDPLDAGEQAELDQLQARDREVRQHEQAHKAAGGAHAGAISYEYTRGPDGKRYAVGGEVSIDLSKERDPAATIAKMRQVKAAANAPADPSSQDRAVAAEASRLEMQARRELRQQAAEPANGAGRENRDNSGDSTNPAGAGGFSRLDVAARPSAPGGGTREALDVMA
ncbi:MAG: hypothetical protein LBU23_01240 [Planctomycetota bacterium]|jgi:hypothetical protein|nr:hypothetical protein [Planctomycetota bacterium]